MKTEDWRKAYPVGSTGLDVLLKQTYKVVEHVEGLIRSNGVAPTFLSVTYGAETGVYNFVTDDHAERFFMPHLDSFDLDFPSTAVCEHTWTTYVGLIEAYHYCTKCDKRRDHEQA